MNISLVIKLGTSDTVILSQGEGIVLSEPSCLAVSDTGRDRVLRAVGVKAKKLLGRADSNTEIIFPIANGVVADEEMAIVMLKTFLFRILKKGFRKPNIKAIVLIPVGTTYEQADAFERVCFECGIGEVILLPNALCGAVGMNMPVMASHAGLILNLGCGTTDAMVISGGRIIAGAGLDFGGVDLERSIDALIFSKFGLLVPLDAPEKIKNSTASLLKNDVSSEEISGVLEDSKQPQTNVVSAQDLFPAVSAHFQKIAQFVSDLIKTCSPEVAQDISESGIYICGANAAIPGVEQFFAKELGISVLLDDACGYVEVIGGGKLLADSKMLKSFREEI